MFKIKIAYCKLPIGMGVGIAMHLILRLENLKVPSKLRPILFSDLSLSLPRSKSFIYLSNDTLIEMLKEKEFVTIPYINLMFRLPVSLGNKRLSISSMKDILQESSFLLTEVLMDKELRSNLQYDLEFEQIDLDLRELWKDLKEPDPDLSYLVDVQFVYRKVTTYIKNLILKLLDYSDNIDKYKLINNKNK